MNWSYGAVRQKDGKIRVWEIMDEGKYLWGHPAIYSWMFQELWTVFKDLYYQRKNLKRCFPEAYLMEGNKKMTKHIAKQIKKIKGLEVKA